jgi:hypothetical protein
MAAVLPLPRLPSPTMILASGGVCEGHDEPVMCFQVLPDLPRAPERTVEFVRGRFETSMGWRRNSRDGPQGLWYQDAGRIPGTLPLRFRNVRCQYQNYKHLSSSSIALFGFYLIWMICLRLSPSSTV